LKSVASDGLEDHNYDENISHQRSVYSEGTQWSGTRHMQEYYDTGVQIGQILTRNN